MPIPRTASWPRSAHPHSSRHRQGGVAEPPLPASAHSSVRRTTHRRTPLSHDLYSEPNLGGGYHQTTTDPYFPPPSSRPPASNFSDVEECLSDGDDLGNPDDPSQGYDVDEEGFESDASETAYTHTPCSCSACGGSPPHREVESYALTHPNFQPLTYHNSHPHSHSHPHQHYSKPEPVTLTTIFFRFLNQYVLPYLPADIAAVIRDPPDLTRPQTLVPLLRAVAPYTQYLLVLLFFYIIWAFVAGFIGYTVRFLRFCFKIGPVIALIAWVMAASGQGGIDVIFEALKQYAGLDGGAAAPPARHQAGGRARANHNGYAGSAYGTKRRNTGSSGSNWRKPAPPADQPDILSAIFGNPATGDAGMGAQVQSFVKGAVARGLGLDWLVSPPKEEKKKSR